MRVDTQSIEQEASLSFRNSATRSDSLQSSTESRESNIIPQMVKFPFAGKYILSLDPIRLTHFAFRGQSQMSSYCSHPFGMMINEQLAFISAYSSINGWEASKSDGVTKWVTEGSTKTCTV
ncbi:hypothetical protein FGO68_gene291 [Halteria grandinella]|uniref:Uncharacterized protein n=1 Tax=Halteria grandinella TaxID=5974 RepID=A0A8J8NHV8_HALGN|nr:hypothetical protein FGO68_gene291 [Halteria grandinella]